MPLNLQALKRLTGLYEVIEEQAAIALRKKMLEANNARQAVERQTDVIRTAGSELRQALMLSDQEKAALVTAESEYAVLAREAMEEIVAEREIQSSLARTKFLEQRIKLEQIKRLHEDVRAELSVEQGRRQQAMADDRFLALKAIRRQANRLEIEK